MADKIILRSLQEEDCLEITAAFKQRGWLDKPITQYQQYLSYQQSGERDVILAEVVVLSPDI